MVTVSQDELDKLFKESAEKKKDAASNANAKCEKKNGKKSESSAKSELLTAAEIEELLAAITNGEELEDKPRPKKIKMHDFKRPDVLSKEDLSCIEDLFGIFCQSLTNAISKKTQQDCFFKVDSVDQLTYEEVTRSLLFFSPKLFVKYNFGHFLVDFDREVTYSMLNIFEEETDEAKRKKIDEEIEKEYAEELERCKKNYGEKDGEKTALEWKIEREKNKYLDIPYRNFSAAEMLRFKKQIQNPFFSVLKKTLTKDLKKFVNFESNIKKWKIEDVFFETNPYAYNIIKADEMVCLVTIHSVCNGLFNGPCSVCFPYKEILKIINEARGIKEMAKEKSIDMNLVQDTTVPVEVVLGGTNKTLKEISSMGEGTIIELDKFARAPVDVRVNGKVVGHGEVVVIDENFGVRLTDFETAGTKKTKSTKTSKSEARPEKKSKGKKK